MFNRKNILNVIIVIGLLLATNSPKVIAKVSLEIPISKQENVHFRRIEQPLGLKAAVALGGIGLIGLELWWFIFSKSKAVKADRNKKI